MSHSNVGVMRKPDRKGLELLLVSYLSNASSFILWTKMSSYWSTWWTEWYSSAFSDVLIFFIRGWKIFFVWEICFTMDFGGASWLRRLECKCPNYCTRESISVASFASFGLFQEILHHMKIWNWINPPIFASGNSWVSVVCPCAATQNHGPSLSPD